MQQFVFITPEIGFTVRYKHRDYSIAAIKPYKRKTDGAQSNIITWEADCMGCRERFTFTTGSSAGSFNNYCKNCLADYNSAAKERVQRERELQAVPSPALIHQSVKAIYPAKMSLALNAPRAIYGPKLLRDACDALASYSFAEIKSGIDAALAQKWIAWEEVGRTKCGHKEMGLWPRPDKFLRQLGMIKPDPESVFD